MKLELTGARFAGRLCCWFFVAHRQLMFRTDSIDCDVLAHRQKALDFLQRVETLGGRVLVHCVAGVSRSVTIVLMHLMERHGLRLRQAWEYMLSVRPFMAPNEGFRLQLAKLEVRRTCAIVVLAMH